jgi:uncharacterized membrane protein
MSNTIVVITFRKPGRAQTVFEALRAMRKKPLYDLDAAMVVTRDHQGEMRPLQTGRAKPKTEDSGTNTLAIVFRLTSLLLPEANSEPGTKGRTMEDLAYTMSRWGLDLEFFRAVAQELRNDSSAIFFLVSDESIGDVGEIVHVLSLFHGRIHRTHISERAVARLHELVDG